MIHKFEIMIFLGFFCFILFGFAGTNSIESKQSKIIENTFVFISAFGFFLSIIGIIGCLIFCK